MCTAVLRTAASNVFGCRAVNGRLEAGRTSGLQATELNTTATASGKAGERSTLNLLLFRLVTYKT
jgi:hypothetical protein